MERRSRGQNDNRIERMRREVTPMNTGAFGNEHCPQQTRMKNSAVNNQSREARYVDLSHAKTADRMEAEITRRREMRRKSVYGGDRRDGMRHMSDERRAKHSNSYSGKPQGQYISEKRRRAEVEEMAAKPVRRPVVERSEMKKERTPKKLLLSICLAVLLAAAVGYSMYAFLRAENINVDGNINVPAETVVALSGIGHGDHVFGIDKGEAKIGIESNPYLMFKDVRYTFPQTVTICVEERIAMACIPLEDMYVVIDAEGVVLDIPLTAPDLPVVSGLMLNQYQKGYRMRTDDSYKQATLEDILSAVEAAELDVNVQSIDLTDVNHIMLTTGGGMQIVIGQNERLADKMRWIKTVIPELEKEGITSGSLDVTVEGSAAYSPDTQTQDTAPADEPKPTKDVTLTYPDGTMINHGDVKTDESEPQTDGTDDEQE